MKSINHLLFLFFFLLSQFIASAENYPVGTRAASLGNASVTLNDLWSVNHNQAGLGYIKKFSTGVNYENRFLLNKLSLKAMAIVIPSKDGTFGLSINSFGYVLYHQQKYGLAYGRTFGEKISMGIQLACFTTKIAEDYGRATNLVAEVGVQVKPIKDLTLGVHLFNPTLSKVSSHFYLPAIMRLGFDYKFSQSVFFAGEIQKEINAKPVFKAGLEYGLMKEFYLRTGISTNPSLNAVGCGLKLKQFKLDFSSSFYAVLGFTSQVGLTYEVK